MAGHVPLHALQLWGWVPIRTFNYSSDSSSVIVALTIGNVFRQIRELQNRERQIRDRQKQMLRGCEQGLGQS